MKKLDKRLLRMIQKTKGQFIAVAAVITIGLASFVGMKMGIVNLENTVNDYYALTHKSDLLIQVVKIPSNKVDRIGEVAHVADYNPRIVADTFMHTEGEEKVKLRVISTRKEDAINKPYLVEGRWIQNPSKEVMVIETFAKARGIQVGDTIDFSAEGKFYSLSVCAIVTSSEYIYVIEDEQTLLPDFSRFGILYADVDFVKRAFGFGDAYNEALIRVDDQGQLDKTADRLEDLLEPYGVKRIYDAENSISDRMVQEEIAQGQKSSMAIPLIFLSVAAVIMSVMIARTVKNDRLTIGIIKALGYSNLQVVIHYTQYALAIGLVGALMGCGLGVYLAGAIAQMYADMVFNLPLITGKLYPEYLLMAILLTLLFCVGAGIAGAREVIGISPAESMRPEAPKSGKRILLEKLPWIWQKVPFTWKIVIRSLMRSKKRGIFLVLGISLTFAITILPIFMIDEFLNMFNYQFGGFMRFDYSINFNRPVSEKLEHTIKSLVAVDSIEPKVEVPFELVNGWRDKAVNVIGLESDTVLYRLEDLEGRTIQLQANRIYLSENLARYLNINANDKILIRNYIPGRPDQHLTVGAIISQKLGSNAYMERGSMNTLLLDDGLVTSYLVNSREDIKAVFSNYKHVSSVQSVSDMRDTFKQFMNLTYSSLFIMLGCAFVLGFAILYNAAIMSIHERTIEFSSLRVMGFEQREIFKMITRENIILTCLGILAGIPLSMAMMRGMKDAFSNEMYTFGTTISEAAFIQATASVLLFMLVSLYATYEKIHKLDFIDALKARVS